MIRRRYAPRADARERLDQLGFAHAEMEDGPYWDESAAYELTALEIDTLEEATAEIQRLCEIACVRAVTENRFCQLGIPEQAWPIVTRSWTTKQPSLYGRLDLRWDGRGPAKLLEFNADTPTALYEASVVQWDWLRSVEPAADQFNSLHEALIAAWGGFTFETIHFASLYGSVEDKVTVDYLRDTAIQAGLKTSYLTVGDVGWNGSNFTDLSEEPIEALFKLYPWEWLLRDPFAAHLPLASTRWVEPAWRLILSSKGLLALLWELFPGHPNLLPAYRERGFLEGAVIRKPLFGREGANITTNYLDTAGLYGGEGFVYQRYAELPCFDGQYPVIGSWLVTGHPAGIGIREDQTPITRDSSRFIPHFFRP